MLLIEQFEKAYSLITEIELDKYNFELIEVELLKENADLSKVGITLAKLMIKSKELERGKNE